MSNGELTAPGLPKQLISWWHDKRIRALAQGLCLIGIGAVAAVAKNASLPLGIPGHSAILWLAPLIAGRAMIRRDGAGTLMGISLALWGLPIGLNNGIVHNLGLYGFTGLALDLSARLPHINIRNPFGAIFCGAVAHMIKFCFLMTAALTSSVTTHFMIFGILKSAGLHLAFGAAAGLIGWLVYKGGQAGKNKLASRSHTDGAQKLQRQGS